MRQHGRFHGTKWPCVQFRTVWSSVCARSVFFESGAADIKSSSQSAFSRIVLLLTQRNSRIRIEGHTDDVPIHNSRFNSNWELSTTRATELVRLLMLKYQIAPDICRPPVTAPTTRLRQTTLRKGEPRTDVWTWWFGVDQGRRVETNFETVPIPRELSGNH
jgi:hypothetical protein